MNSPVTTTTAPKVRVPTALETIGKAAYLAQTYDTRNYDETVKKIHEACEAYFAAQKGGG